MARKPSGPPPKSKRPAPTSTRTVAAANPVIAAPAGRAIAPDSPRGNSVNLFARLPLFAGQVRAEARKITWTTWRETWITSLMVFAMVFITGLFFLLVDQIMSHGMQFLLQLAA